MFNLAPILIGLWPYLISISLVLLLLKCLLFNSLSLLPRAFSRHWHSGLDFQILSHWLALSLLSLVGSAFNSPLENAFSNLFLYKDTAPKWVHIAFSVEKTMHYAYSCDCIHVCDVLTLAASSCSLSQSVTPASQ